MKKLLFYLSGLALLASCASPKYTYYFDRHTYQSVGKNPVREKAAQELTDAEVRVQQENLRVEPSELVAATEKPAAAETAPIMDKVKSLSGKYSNIKEATTKTEARALRKELRGDLKDLKKDLKAYAKEKRDLAPDSADAFKDLDKYLRFAIIFALAAVVASLIPGLWYVGSVLGLVALIFLILWLVEQ